MTERERQRLADVIRDLHAERELARKHEAEGAIDLAQRRRERRNMAFWGFHSMPAYRAFVAEMEREMWKILAPCCRPRIVK